MAILDIHHILPIKVLEDSAECGVSVINIYCCEPLLLQFGCMKPPFCNGRVEQMEVKKCILFSGYCTRPSQQLLLGPALCWQRAFMVFPSDSASQLWPTAAAKYKTLWRNVVNSHCCEEKLQIVQQEKKRLLKTSSVKSDFDCCFSDSWLQMTNLHWFLLL